MIAPWMKEKSRAKAVEAYWGSTIEPTIGRTQPERAAGLKFPGPFRLWVSRALPEDTYRIVPLTPAICADAFDLPGDFHKDPWDMMIVATARVENLVLLTADEDIATYPHVRRRCFTPVRVNRGRHRSPQ